MLSCSYMCGFFRSLSGGGLTTQIPGLLVRHSLPGLLWLLSPAPAHSTVPSCWGSLAYGRYTLAPPNSVALFPHGLLCSASHPQNSPAEIQETAFSPLKYRQLLPKSPKKGVPTFFTGAALGQDRDLCSSASIWLERMVKLPFCSILHLSECCPKSPSHPAWVGQEHSSPHFFHSHLPQGLFLSLMTSFDFLVCV